MAYQLHEKSPGGSIQQSPITQYEQGMEPVDYHGQYPEHYIPGPEPPQVHTPSTSTYTPQMKSDLPPVPPATTKTGATTLGMKRSVFWILVGLLVLLVVLVIGLGAGLGTKVAQANSQTASSNSSTATSSASSSSTTLPTATYTSAASTATPTIPCPSQNLTLYTATTSVKAEFRLYCGFDFSGSEADDLTSLDTVSMEACMDVCASTDTCQGAGWGTTGELSSTAYTCYLKTNLTTPHSATDGWCFAVNLNTTDSFTI